MGRLDLPDPRRDEDDGPDEAFWRRAGVRETITPEIAAKVSTVRAKRDGSEPIALIDRMNMSRTLTRHTPDLSPRETQILTAVADGLDNQQIAVEFSIGVETVKSHMRSLLVKLGARNRTHAVALAYHRGLLVPRAA